MANLSALLYPVSLPKGRILRFLSLFFDQLHVILPSEGSVQDIERHLEDLPANKKVIPHIPSPLGNKQEWFRSLVRDWHKWADQMGLGTEGADASMMEAASAIMEESLQSIVYSIKGKDQRDLDLEAQIFLQLALELDIRDDELAEELEQLSSRQDELKILLAGPATGDDEQGKHLQHVGIEPILQGKRRLAAWSRLYFKSKDLSGLHPVGEGINTKDYIDQAYESLGKSRVAIDLFDLSLSMPEDTLSKKASEIRPLIDTLAKELVKKGRGAAQDEELAGLCKDIVKLWPDSKQSSGPRLVLTLYPDATWNELLSRATRITLPESFGGKGPYWSFYLV